MDKNELKRLENILYEEDKKVAIDKIKRLDDPILLHIFAGNYNWDNGFEIPYTIINNENCDLGTALMLFYSADGYRMLESESELSSDNEWMKFLSKLYSRIKDIDFKSQNISYTPQISKVQIFKLKKKKPNIPDIFFERSLGTEIDIPML